MFNAVGIYKIPAIWNIDKNLHMYKDKQLHFKISKRKQSFNEHSHRITNIMDNIYLNLFIEIIISKNIKDANFIFVDESLDTCIQFDYNNIKIWILKTKSDVLNFDKANFYFLRGCYHDFYNELIPKDAYVLFYPATSMVYDYNINYNTSISKKNISYTYNKNTHDVFKKYNCVLVHEDPQYKKIYKYSKHIPFLKFPSKMFMFLNIPRIYDFIFVADATQHTKNHNLMFDFIRYCENIKFRCSIIYVSNSTILKKNYKNYIDATKYAKITFFDNIHPSELCILYNETKINLTLSGRDACPRTISESLICGCYNVALDTLSDGKSYYNNIFGELVGHNNLDIKLGKSRSLCYVGNDILWKKILDIHSHKINHTKISLLTNKKYNIKNIINAILLKI